MEEVKNDPRFCHIAKDARFRRLPKKHVKIKVDKRFESMFTDKKFQIKCKVDKRGRPLGVGGAEDLKRYYDLSGSEKELDSEEEEEEEEGGEEEAEKDEEDVEESGEEDDSDGEDPEKDQEEVKDVQEEVSKPVKKAREKTARKAKDADGKPKRKLITKEIKKKLRNSKIDYARGEATLFSESSSEEELSDVDDSEVEEHDWGQFDNDAETTEEASNRLAICNMDWDRIKAADLMVLFHSFLPPGGLIHSITIYPSEFGARRMKEEEEKGPNELLTDVAAENEDDGKDRKHMEKLRRYQLNRLRYYYAIMVCDTIETASALYKECDGLEYESSSVKLDLRFVPDDTTFDQEPKDACTALPDLSTYRPRLFQTTALTRSKVELTWDENDPDREDAVRSVHRGRIDEEQLKQYLACSSSSCSSDEEEKDEESVRVTEDGGKPETEQSSIDKYKSLLADIESNERKKKEKGNEVDLEVTWNLELENKASEIVRERIKDKDALTPFEEYVEKKKEKKKKKRLERKAQVEQMQKGSDESEDDVPSDVDLDDPYFKEELDQMNGTSKKKKKKKRKLEEEEEETEEDKHKKAELELLMLDDDDDDDRRKHFSLKKIEESEKASSKRRKGKKRKVAAEETADDFEIDVNDERFSALYTSHHFNIDPTDPQYRATKATKELINEKLRRRAAEELPGPRIAGDGAKKKKKNSELNLLVKNIKKYAEDVKK